MKTKRFNIALIPNLKVFKYAIYISKKLSRFRKHHYILDGKNYFPHITIYSPLFPQINLNRIIKELIDITKDIGPIRINFTEVKFINNYIGVDIQKSANIYSLHEKIVNRLNPLREGVLRDKYKEKEILNELDQDKIKNIQKYGYPDVKELYIPHLTLIHFEKDISSILEKKFKWNTQKSIIGAIGIFEMGDYGTCVKLIRDFKLSIK